MITYSIERIINRERGLGRADSILILLEDMGEIPDYLRQRILDESDMDTLKKWLRYAKTARSIKDFENMAVSDNRS